MDIFYGILIIGINLILITLYVILIIRIWDITVRKLGGS